MFKKIFSAAKNLLRSPVGQVGLGILVPGLAGSSNALLSGIGAFAKTNPALFQAGLGLASGAKPEDVLRNVAFSAGTSALRGGMSGQGGVSEFFGMGQPAAKQIAPAVQNIPQGGSMTISGDASQGILDAIPTEANMSGTLNLPTTRTPVTDKTFLQKMGLEITEKVNPVSGEMIDWPLYYALTRTDRVVHDNAAPLGLGLGRDRDYESEDQAENEKDPDADPDEPYVPLLGACWYPLGDAETNVPYCMWQLFYQREVPLHLIDELLSPFFPK